MLEHWEFDKEKRAIIPQLGTYHRVHLDVS